MPAPPPPQRPLPPDEVPKRGPWVSIVLATFVAVLISIGLSLISMGLFFVVLVVAAVVLGFAGLHYLVWGWWLAGSIRDDDESE